LKKASVFPHRGEGEQTARWWLTMLVEILDEVDDAI
jgi:hypothetical protein|tara:strand:+ start:1218 stop:1325 length:108 start_codon:yes stop_codon:yes gene_type:complete